MGQTLSTPITDKTTASGGDKKFIYASSSMQGWRITMEDAHTTLLEADLDNKASFFAVFDGHGGSNAAIFAGETLHKQILETPAFKEANYEEAIRRGFMKTDEEFLKTTSKGDDHSGCTAVCVIITPDNHLYCGNAGDSRAILDENCSAVELSFDHKPGNPEEYDRIIKGGGTVEYGRVNGNLALSRALGDFDFKRNDKISDEEQIVTALPDVISRKITADDDFIVIACDGIWDCLTNAQVAHYVRKSIISGNTLDQVCEDLMHKCLADECGFGGVGCDNMTVVIVGILSGKTEQEWYDHIRSKPLSDVDMSDIDNEHSAYAEDIVEEELDHISGTGSKIVTLSEEYAQDNDLKNDTTSSSEEPTDSIAKDSTPTVLVELVDQQSNDKSSQEETLANEAKKD
ncbi:hypothetical protein BB561_001011 [Smittium simulii]|uniref:protein-serine/threonine phosphatase n=1 Tax=Smittium simulii TaxID=133385 RepID=A0A2T9YWL6_9FUNG|nr:hypothetical protein BB561_001011 [Smittium simulii]